ncbi:hypothetical protein EDL99_08175 [Ornithobacterium rhinotracheale]|uniref:hypothetical protein n=1 Tax=Ornithobacterium rhinotracheale TaxID=28251 RepID=UPI00129C80B3|nr:hypothetical protein [Ornithobacterium rhinotracheale]MRJ08840.1 hypothetical protein [Ornithobacterium rhinotracheale]UOH77721.1 hypothetical protein MT996_11015 [Ornithobacterium rhinotracheale]
MNVLNNGTLNENYILIEFQNKTNQKYFIPILYNNLNIFSEFDLEIPVEIEGPYLLVPEYIPKDGYFYPANLSAYYIDSLQLDYYKNIILSQEKYAEKFVKKDSIWILKHYLLMKNSFILNPGDKKTVRINYIPLTSEAYFYTYISSYDIEKGKKYETKFIYTPHENVTKYLDLSFRDSLKNNGIKIFDKKIIYEKKLSF